MCLIVLAHRQHPDYPLLVSANRDEYHQRPTLPAHIWPGSLPLLAGKDLTAGGTWLGVTAAGRFAAITNHRNPPTTPAMPRSRGLLTVDFLRGQVPARAYLRELSREASEYAGFNLLLGEGKDLYYYSNIEGEVRELGPGVYGVSNALLDIPWPKLSKGRERLRALLEELDENKVMGEGPALHDHLAAVVGDRSPAPDDRLPNTGLDIELERMLSSQFICSPDYGTRATTTLVRHGDGRIRFAEQSFLAGGKPNGSTSFELTPVGDE